MNSAFLQTIENSSAGKKSRDNITSLVIENPEYVNDLAAIAFDPTHKNHYKAIWIFELLAEQKMELLFSYIDNICKTAPQYQHESAIRGISRIVCFISNSKIIALTENQKDTLIEICLDWLIGDAKIAPKMYAMYALSHFMTE